MQMFKNDKNQQAGVSIKIEVAGRFEKSNLATVSKRGFYFPFSRGVWGRVPLENFKISMP